MALTGNAPVGQPQGYPGQTGNQMQYAPAGPQGMAPVGPQGTAPVGPPGTAPAAAGGAENKNPGAGKLQMILIGIVGVIAIFALVFAVIGILPGAAEDVEDEEDTISIKDFSVENFVITSELHEFEYSENTISWDGSGEITISDTKNVFFVALKKILVSGGNDSSTKEICQIIIVEDGSGTFSTYVYGDEPVTPEPKYEFEILGFSQLSK